MTCLEVGREGHTMDTRTLEGRMKVPGTNVTVPLTDSDRWILSQTDEEFHLHSWEELKQIIAANRLETLKRRPSDLRRYIIWSTETKEQYGSVTAYILAHRLPTWGQPPFSYQSSIPFLDASDYQILQNDWPYGLEDGITHLVVWSKTPIETDDNEGDVTAESRSRIETFVKNTFVSRLGEGAEDRVVWFKNWVKLQSVRALEHVHVLVKDASVADLDFWTGKRTKSSEVS